VRGIHIASIVESSILNACGPRNRNSGFAGKLIVRAAQHYYRFCQLDLTFENSRILAEAFEAPRKLADYLSVCISNPPNLSIFEAFMDDAEMFSGLQVRTLNNGSKGASSTRTTRTRNLLKNIAAIVWVEVFVMQTAIV